MTWYSFVIHLKFSPGDDEDVQQLEKFKEKANAYVSNWETHDNFSVDHPNTLGAAYLRGLSWRIILTGLKPLKEVRYLFQVEGGQTGIHVHFLCMCGNGNIFFNVFKKAKEFCEAEDTGSLELTCQAHKYQAANGRHYYSTVDVTSYCGNYFASKPHIPTTGAESGYFSVETTCPDLKGFIHDRCWTDDAEKTLKERASKAEKPTTSTSLELRPDTFCIPITNCPRCSSCVPESVLKDQ